MAVVRRERSSTPTNRRLVIWVGLLALAQLADIVTTGVDMSVGGVEANRIAANLLMTGGLALLSLIKFGLVAAMALAAILARRFWLCHRDRRAEFVQVVVWRGLQVCVLVLGLTAVHNVAVLTQILSEAGG